MKKLKLMIFAVAGFSLALGATDTDQVTDKVLNSGSEQSFQGQENGSNGVDYTPVDTNCSSASEEKQTSFIETFSAKAGEIASRSKELFEKSQEIVKPILNSIADQATGFGTQLKDAIIEGSDDREALEAEETRKRDEAKKVLAEKIQDITSIVGDFLESGKTKVSEVVADLDKRFNNDQKEKHEMPAKPKQATFTEFISEYRYAVGASVVIVAGAVSLYVYHLYNEKDQDADGNGN